MIKMKDEIKVKLSTLRDIGDSIREKDGTTALIPISKLAERNRAIPSGGGDEKFKSLVAGSIAELTTDDLADVTYIRSHLFSGTRLEKVVIPDNIFSVGGYAFAYCEKLTDITIGAGVKVLGLNAFDYAGYYTVEQEDYSEKEFWRPITIRFLSETPPFAYLLSRVFSNCEIEKIIVPKGSLEAWTTNYYTKESADKMEEASE